MSAVPVDEIRVITDEELAEWGEVVPAPKRRKDGRVLRSQKVRLYPTRRQEEYFVKCVDAARYSYNRALDLWQRLYEETGKASLAAVRRIFNTEKDEHSPWLREVSHCVPKGAVGDLGDAFERFFDGQCKYPNFKRRKGKNKSSKRSFKADNGSGTFDVCDRGNPERPGLRIPLPACVNRAEFGLVKMARKLRWGGELRSVTISQDAAGRWFAAITMLTPDDSTAVCESQALGGADVGSRHLIAETDSTLHENPRALERMQKKRKRLQHQLQRRTPGSGGWLDTKQRLARLETRAADLRNDATHKATRKVADKYGMLGIETLNVAGLMKGRNARSLQDANPGETLRQIGYKSHRNKAVVVAADRWFPSSKRCSQCGTVNKDLEGEEHWTCPCCGARHQRDINSSANLAGVAEAVMQVGRVPSELTRVESTAMTKDITSRVNQTSVKLEPQ